MIITITPSAEKQISDLCYQNSKMVRLAITSGGCQGFSKVWDLTDVQDDDDIVYDLIHGKLLIDPGSLDIIQGAIVDYKNDLSGSYFTVDIPSATSTCGCGTSFSI